MTAGSVLRGALCAALLLACASFPPGRSAEAASVTLVPSATVEGRWDTNVYNASADEKSDFVARAAPRLTLSVGVLQSTVSLHGGFEAEYFREHTDLNRFTATRNFDLSTSTPLRFTPQFSLLPSVRYVETHDAVRRNQLSESPIPGLPPSETIVTGKTGVREIAGSLQAAYLFTRTVNGSLGAGATRRDYLDTTDDRQNTRDYKANGSIGYAITPRLNTGLYSDVGYSEYGNGNDSRMLTGGLTGRYLLSPFSTIDLNAGATHVRSDDTVDAKWRPNGRFSFTNVWQSFSVILRGSIDMVPGSFGRTNKRENVQLSMSEHLSQDWSWDASASYQSNRSIEPPILEDILTLEWTAAVHYSLARWASLRLTGDIFRQWAKGAVGSDLFRNQIVLGIDVATSYPIY